MARSQTWVFRVPDFQEKFGAQGGCLSWFRIDTRLMNSPRFTNLSQGAQLLYLWVASECAAVSSRECQSSAADLLRVCRRKPAGVLECIQELVDLEWIQVVRTPRREEKRREKKREEKNTATSETEVAEPKQISLVISADPKPTPVGVYVEAYQQRYGHRPQIGGREGKILGTFAKNHPQQWEALIRGFLQMPDPWAIARSHPVELLVTKVNEIGRFLATGKVATKKVLQYAEDLVDKAQGTERKPRRPLEEVIAENERMMAEACSRQKALPGKEG